MLCFHSIRKDCVTHYVANTVFATFWDTIVRPTELGTLWDLNTSAPVGKTHNSAHKKTASKNADGDGSELFRLCVKITVALWVWQSSQLAQVLALLCWV